MRWMIISLTLLATAGCSVNRLYLRPVAVVRDGAAGALSCEHDAITVRRLGTTAYEQTAALDAYVAEGCGQVAWFVCDGPGSTGQCLEVPEPPYQPPPPTERTALVQIVGAWQGPLPGGADRYWERISFGDGYSARYVSADSSLAVALRPTPRRIRLAAGPSSLQQRELTRSWTHLDTESCYRGGRRTTCTTAHTTHTTYHWTEREHRRGCAVDATLEPSPGSVYRIEYRVVAGQCRARCAKLGPGGSSTCEGWSVQPGPQG